MFRYRAIRIGVLCLAAAFAGSHAFAQSKIAIVDMQKAISSTDEVKKASAAAELKYKPRRDALTKLEADLQSIEQQLSGGKLTEAAAADLQTQGQRKQRDYQRLADDLQQDLDRESQDVLGKALAKMRTVVSKLAEEKGLDVILDVSQSIYSKPALEVTNDAIAAYNKANPAK